MIEKLKSFYSSRVKEIDIDFLNFEEEMADPNDLAKIIELCELYQKSKDKINRKILNPHNSILLYITELSDEFDFKKARADTTGGSPPDIDLDFDARQRYKIIDWVKQKWGENKVSNIVTYGTLKPKSLARKYYSINELPDTDLDEVLKKIPDPKFGKEPTFEEVFEAHPDLEKNPKFDGFVKAAKVIGNLVSHVGVHAAGLVISDFPIYDTVPLMIRNDTENIDGVEKKITKLVTQFDMKEVETLGLIKYDFLSIENLSIIKETVKLLEARGLTVDPYSIEDGDAKAYQAITAGYLTGVFQMETSGSAKMLAAAIKPKNLGELSDISALNRPGPQQAGLDKAYIENKESGQPDSSMPKQISDLLKNTYYTIIYQEDVMRICTDIAGFSLKESDDIRRAMGKKNKVELDRYAVEFVNGCVKSGIDKSYANALWETLLGFADYCFNKSHSIAYAYITYLCAYFKVNYPAEFFCALMTIRSQSMQPADWAAKAPEYLSEANHFGVQVHSPKINQSDMKFIIKDNNIYFGFSAIRDVGKTAANHLLKSRGKTPFKDIYDFLARVDRTKINRKTFEALVVSGTFDRMGYKREDLLEHIDALYDYFSNIIEFNERKQLIEEFESKNNIQNALIEEKEFLTEKLRKSSLKKNPGEDLTLTEQERLQVLKDMKLRRLAQPKEKENPELSKVEIQRYKQVPITLRQLIAQGAYLGCFIGKHPASIIYPNSQKIVNSELGDYVSIAGAVLSIKVIKTKKKQLMAFMEIADDTALCEIVIFPSTYEKLIQSNRMPALNDLVNIEGKVEGVETKFKVIANQIVTYNDTEE